MRRIPLEPLVRRLAPVRRFFVKIWNVYRALALWLQTIIAVVLIILFFALISFLISLGVSKDSGDSLSTVTLVSVSELSGNSSSVGGIGSVRSVTEAAILAESSGTVRRVHTRLGGTVPAGFVIAELENASQRAAVLQAEGAYDAAVAARAGASPVDISTSALNTYTSAYQSLDSILETYIDTFYGDPGAFGPKFLVSPGTFGFEHFSTKRAQLNQAMIAWRSRLDSASSKDSAALLAEAEGIVRQAHALATDIATVATRTNSDATSAQLTALTTARSSIASLQATITSAKQTYQSQGTSATAGADASVKSALGSLRAAQANLEKTLVRAPIGGQVNYLPIRVGDYVTSMNHVATVAQNGALEIVAFVSEETRSHLSVGMKVTLEEDVTGVITSIAPALDPVTKQVEVHVAVSGTSNLVNGQSVRIAFPSAPAPSTATSTGPVLLPLATLKLTPSARVLFTLGEDGRLKAFPVEIGEVRGDRIEILTSLPAEMRIVSDARGLSDGQKVNLAEGTSL